MPSWPIVIPRTPLAGTLNETPGNNRAEFVPDVGPPLRRRRSSVATANVAFDLSLTAAEFDLLDDFYRDTLQDGSLSFTMPDPRTGSESKWQFAQPFTGRERGLGTEHYLVSVSLMRLP